MVVLRDFFLIMHIQIDPEFKALIPPLSTEELEQLEANIIKDGCRDPLVLWGEILIDGHNRHEICTRNFIPFKTVVKNFENRDDAMDWMDANQLGRRNIQPQQADFLRGRIYNRRKKAVGSNLPQNRLKDQNDPLVSTAEQVATETGVSPATVKRNGKMAEEVENDPELLAAINDRTEFKKVKREKKEKKRESRRQQNREKIESAPEPEKIIETGAKFATIVIDPPWDWGDEGDQDQMGRARPDYATMSKEQLMALPVGALADDDCHLYMWITNRSLPKGFDLIKAWGFRYITAITWAKPSFGMGNYFRGQTEQILFAVKGSQPLKRKDVGTLFTAPRGPNGHSSKPVEFYDLVESCSPGPFIEMFSRHNREGWTTWGEGQ
jgi:N6-adenosine-specific RNA methylase IME4